MDLKIDYNGKAHYITQKQQLLDDINQTGVPLVLFGYFIISPDFISQIKVPLQYWCDNNFRL